MIFGTFEQGNASGVDWPSRYPYSSAGSPSYCSTIGGVTPWNNLFVDGCTGWDLAQVDSSGTTAAGNKVYTAPVGLGYIGAYLSPSGTLDQTDGRVFFCPGTPASFNKGGYLSDTFVFGNSYGGIPSLLLPRNNQAGDGLYSTFLSDWNKGVGQGGGNPGSAPWAANPLPGNNYYDYQLTSCNPWVYSTYIYRSGNYYDSVDSSGVIHGTFGVNLGYGTGLHVWRSVDSAYPKSDAPFLNGECFVVCNSLYPMPLEYPYPGREVQFNDLCHGGKMVNRAFHDGSASTWKVPNGHFPPADCPISGASYLFELGPNFPWAYAEGYQGYYSAGYPGIMQNGFNEWPYLWVCLDNRAKVPEPAAGW
jgi:hypothetical protein